MIILLTILNYISLFFIVIGFTIFPFLPFPILLSVSKWRVLLQLTPFFFLNYILHWDRLKFILLAQISFLGYFALFVGSNDLKDYLRSDAIPIVLKSEDLDSEKWKDHRLVTVRKFLNGGSDHSVIEWENSYKSKAIKEKGEDLSEENLSRTYYLAFSEKESPFFSEESPRGPKPSFIVETKRFRKYKDVPDLPIREKEITGFIEKQAEDLSPRNVYELLKDKSFRYDISALPVLTEGKERPLFDFSIFLFGIGCLFALLNIFSTWKSFEVIDSTYRKTSSSKNPRDQEPSP